MLSQSSNDGNRDRRKQRKEITDSNNDSVIGNTNSDIITSADARHLLPSVVANTVSKLAGASRFSLQCVSLTAQASFFVMKHGTRASLSGAQYITENMLNFLGEFEKRLFRGATDESSATGKGQKTGNTTTPSRVEVARNLFAVAEWMAMGAINQSEYLTHNTIKIVNLTWRLVDGLFGATDTSESLRAFYQLLSREFRHSPDRHIKSITDLGTNTVWKAMMAWNIIQQQTLERREAGVRSSWQLSLIAEPEDRYVERMQNTNADIAGLKEVFEAVAANVNNMGTSSDRESFDGGGTTSRASNYTDLSSMDPSMSDIDESSLFPNPHINIDEAADSLNNIIPNPWRPIDCHRPSMDLIRLLAKYVRYASAVYGRKFLRIFGLARFSTAQNSSNHQHGYLDEYGRTHASCHWMFAQHTGLPLAAILVSTQHRPTKKYCPRIVPALKSSQMELPEYVLSVDHQERAICLTIRGTFSLSDTLTNVSCLYALVYVDGKQHRIHAGMLQQALGLAADPELRAELQQAFDRWPQYGLTLIGHSLGGGIASVLGLLWSQMNVEVPDPIVQEWPRLNHHEDPTLTADAWRSPYPRPAESRTGPRFNMICDKTLRVFAFGPPCSMSLELGRICSQFITALTHGQDFVSSLSFGSVRDLLKVAALLSEVFRADDCFTNGEVKTGTMLSDVVLNHVLYGQRAPAPATHAPTDVSNNNNDKQEKINVSNPTTSQAMVAQTDGQWYDHLYHHHLRPQLSNEKMYPAGDLYWMHSHQVNAPSSDIGRLSVDHEALDPSCNPSTNQPSISPPISSTDPRPSTTNTHNEWQLTRRILLQRVDTVPDLCGDMQISLGMILDHLAGKYELGLRALREALP